MDCPGCGGDLEPVQVAPTVTSFRCPRDECHPRTVLETIRDRILEVLVWIVLAVATGIWLWSASHPPGLS